MCQAYEAEFRYMCWLEDRATLKGYRAAEAGEPNVNPNDARYQKTEHYYWQHGYDCFKGGIVPRAIERERGR